MSDKKCCETDLRTVVREEYSQIAQQGASCCGLTSCCGDSTPEAVAAAVGYDADELADMPDGANMGLSCGNPTRISALSPGDVVLDLGAGGGFDVFIVARKVGPTGRAIGVDMTPAMLDKARKNAIAFREKTGLDNVEFRLGEIENLPVADASVDVVLSNCVVNLSLNKPRVWLEIARVLKPGGRVAVSDLALLRPLPEAVRESVRALTGCIAGAVLVEETRAMMEKAGMVDMQLTAKSDYIDQMTEWADPLYREITAQLPEGTRPRDFITSLDISARKKSPKAKSDTSGPIGCVMYNG